MPKSDSLGLSWSDFKYGIILGAISVILYMGINILQIWYPSTELDIIQTGIFALIIFVALTVMIDYYIASKQKKK